MQGQKNYQETLFTNFQLSDKIPQDNFYRRLKDVLDFRFLYRATRKYYGKEGQKSIDPMVFFKLMLVGYLENQPSDRRIITTSSMRMDILYFIGYNIDEPLPWHSTLSRTRQLFDEEVFLRLFKLILKQCIDKGMLSGRRQAIDSVFVKANASMDHLEKREIFDDALVYSRELKQSEQDDSMVHELKKEKPGKSSNKTHVSTTDPDSRMSVKPGKVTKLNYLGQVSVDTSSHIITHIEAFHADKRDSQCLDAILEKVSANLLENGLQVEEIVADTNYSSSEALKSLESRGIKGYIPNFGSYIAEREGFQYNKENDLYYCPGGKTLKFSAYRKKHDMVKVYLSNPADCKNCPLKISCIGNSRQKMISDTISKPLYDKMHQRMKNNNGKSMMRVRKSTVEPVIGTLVEYLGMRKVNTRGIKLANKCMILAGMAYNLKKLLKFQVNRVYGVSKTAKNSLVHHFKSITTIIEYYSFLLEGKPTDTLDYKTLRIFIRA